MTVADTGILIWLARYNKLNLLKELYGKIDIPSKVFEEAVTAGKLMDILTRKLSNLP